MGYVPSNTKRVFTYGKHLGFIQDGMFLPIELDEERFKSIIYHVLDNEKYSVNEDLVLQTAIKQYTGIFVVGRLYKGKTKFDSDFYNEWKQYIMKLDKFKRVKNVATDNYRQKKECIVSERAKETFNHVCLVESIIRNC